jgi:outer membrane protein assembly factor BamB
MPAVFEGGVLIATVDGRVLCVNARGDLDWEVEVGGAVLSTPIPENGRVYFGSSDKYLYCVDAGSGSRIWSFEAEGPVEISPCIFEGQVFCASYEGELFALDARDGRLLWTFHSKEVPAVFPSADSGKVFLAVELELYCLDAQSGKSLWEYSTGPSVISNLAVRGNQVVVVRGGMGEISNTISLDARTGDLLWNVSSGETSAWTWLFASNQDVYLCGPDHLGALAVESGTPSMESELRGILPETLTLTENLVFAGTDARKVYCFEE